MDVNMGYYSGLLIIASLLNFLYRYPLKDEEGFLATFNRRQVLGGLLQGTAVYSQLMIIVGLCLDGGRSMTNREGIST